MLELLFLSVVCFFLGWRFGRFIMAKQLQFTLDELAEESAVTDNAPTLCTIEQINDLYFLYEEVTQTFLAKSNSIEGLAEQIKSHTAIDSAVAIMVEDDGAENLFWFCEGKVKQI
jgi:hypothetical protein